MATRGARRDAQSETGLDELMTAARVVTAAVAHSLAVVNAEVSMPQLRVLVMVSANEPMNLSAVADGLGVNASNASRTCDRLVTQGLLHRADDPRDRRHVALTLTDASRALIDTVMTHRRAVLAQVVAGMSEEDRETLRRAMVAFNASAATMSTAGELDDGAGHLLRWLS